MAFRSNGPVTLALPPFRGATRRIILVALVVYAAMLVLSLVAHGLEDLLVSLLKLQPATALHGLVWQFFTYPFVDMGLLSLLFALLSLWFFGAALEEERGGRWLMEFFFASTLGGGLLACILQKAGSGRVWGVTDLAQASGLWPFVLATLLAYARFHPDEQLSFNFIFRIKAKYLAALYLLFYLVVSVLSQARFSAVLALCSALCAYVYLRAAPRRGVRVATSERWFGWRNAYYRAKRRRAAKKFTVYMRKQGKEVSFDDSGRYTGPEDERGNSRNPHDPDDKRWMN